jgi:hypothetical protein
MHNLYLNFILLNLSEAVEKGLIKGAIISIIVMVILYSKKKYKELKKDPTVQTTILKKDKTLSVIRNTFNTNRSWIIAFIPFVYGIKLVLSIYAFNKLRTNYSGEHYKLTPLEITLDPSIDYFLYPPLIVIYILLFWIFKKLQK